MIEEFLKFFSQLNFFDIIFFVVLIYFIIQCFVKGFSLSLISFMKWILSTILTIILGRIFIGWLADRVYIKQFDKWQISKKTSSGVNFSRLINVFLVLALIWPLTLYRSSQFAPDERTCIKQHRAMEQGAEISFKKRFDCFFISEFPILIWIDE